jgi:hypothetical protein
VKQPGPTESQSPVRLYCSYGPLVDRPAFQRLWEDCSRGRRPVPVGRLADILNADVAFNCPSLQWGGRVAGLVPAKGERVPALLYAIDAEDWPTIELAEEYPDRVPVAVRAEIAGIEMRATAFTTRASQATSLCPISKEAMELMARGAQAEGFPAEYVRRLREAPGAESLLSPELMLGVEPALRPTEPGWPRTAR